MAALETLALTDQLTGIVAYGVDNHVGPKTAAIFFDAPAFMRCLPLSDRLVDKLFRQAGLPVFG